MDIHKAGSRPTRRGSADWFTGTVWQEAVNDATPPARLRVAHVTFEPGARTKWHTHPLGQTLYVLSGVGRIQKLGDPVREIRAGDTVWIPPGVKHWHGASPSNTMIHVSMQEHLDGSVATWLEPVSEADYNAAPAT